MWVVFMLRVVERSVSVPKHTTTLLELSPGEPVYLMLRENCTNEDGYGEAVDCIEKKLKYL